MRIVNRTPYPTRAIRVVLRAAFAGGRAPDLVRVRLRAPGSLAAGSISPTGRVVFIGLSSDGYPRSGGSYPGLAGAPRYRVRDWREDLLTIAAHEAVHASGRFGELAAERAALATLRVWRSRP